MRCSVRMIACVLDEVLISGVRIDSCAVLNGGCDGGVDKQMKRNKKN